MKPVPVALALRCLERTPWERVDFGAGPRWFRRTRVGAVSEALERAAADLGCYLYEGDAADGTPGRWLAQESAEVRRPPLELGPGEGRALAV